MPACSRRVRDVYPVHHRKLAVEASALGRGSSYFLARPANDVDLRTDRGQLVKGY